MKSKAAFSLMELLVVIAIVAILAALLFPFLMKAIAKTELTRCANNMSSILKAYALQSNEEVHNAGEKPHLAPATDSYVVIAGNTIKSGGEPCGPGALFPDKDPLTAFETLWCPGIRSSEERANELNNWLHEDEAGGGYLYMWLDPEQIDTDLLFTRKGLSQAYLRTAGDHLYELDRSTFAILMDINSDLVTYGQKWRSHPRLHRVNIGFLDGHVASVKDYPGLVLPAKDTYADWMKIWTEAHKWNSR